MDKIEQLIAEGRYINYLNKNDWDKIFWKHKYIVHVSAQDIIFAVNANFEQDAIDCIIDHCQKHNPGLLFTKEEEEDEEFIDEYISGGNEGLHFSTHNIFIEEI